MTTIIVYLINSKFLDFVELRHVSRLMYLFCYVSEIHRLDLKQWWFCESGYQIVSKGILHQYILCLKAAKSQSLYTVHCWKNYALDIFDIWRVELQYSMQWICRLKNWIISFGFCVNDDLTWAIQRWTSYTNIHIQRCRHSDRQRQREDWLK